MATGTAMTNYLENALLNHVLKGGGAFPQPANVYVALHTADPTETGSVAEMTTTDFSNYVRKLVTFGASVSGSISNAGTDLLWDFNGASAKTVSHISIWDSLTTGNPLFYGALTTAQTLNSGNQFKMAVGSITINLD